VASSPPVRPPLPGDAPDPPPTKWPRWRVLMLIGAVILLGVAILEAKDALPHWALVAIYFTGYVFLAYGFFSALSARRKDGATPRGRG
jgi:hypothetical protein